MRLIAPSTAIMQSQITEISKDHEDIAQRLAQIHGRVRIAREASGIHVYLACPDCLETYGVGELHKMHLAVNLDKYLAEGNEPAGMQGGSAGEQDYDKAGCCMKTGKPFYVSELLNWQPLAFRNIQELDGPKVQKKDVSNYLVDDGNGNMVPKPPGTCQSLLTLSAKHPAREYLAERGFELTTLHKMFRASWCSVEEPGVFYRELKGGFAATPQNRIVFYIYQYGIRRGWQARILEAERQGRKYYLHPYSSLWVPVQARIEGGWEELLPPFDKKFDPAKYVFPSGTLRNQLLMGLDCAIEFAKTQLKQYCFLVEGPLDAARLGPGAIASMGKYFSDEQAALIAKEFTHCIYVGDNDEAGQVGRERVRTRMAKHSNVELKFADVPEEFKDVGEMTQPQADAFREDCLKL